MAWLIFFILMQIGDGFLTWLTLEHFKISKEVNPILDFYFKQFSLVGTLFVVKSFTTISCIFIYRFFKVKKASMSPIIFVTGLYAGVNLISALSIADWLGW